MADCDWSTRLDAYLDGELSPGVAGEVEGHLRNCEACRSDLAALRRMSSAFVAFAEDRALLIQDRNERIVMRIVAAAAAPLAAAAWHAREARQIARLSRAVAAVAACIVIGGIAWVGWADRTADAASTLSGTAVMTDMTAMYGVNAVQTSASARTNDDPEQALAEFALADLRRGR
jgi:anti-sigma factor RsiW